MIDERWFDDRTLIFSHVTGSTVGAIFIFAIVDGDCDEITTDFTPAQIANFKEWVIKQLNEKQEGEAS